YSWEADLRDAVAVVDSVSRHPLPVVGHSKGGGSPVEFASALPHRVSHLVNLDGLPSRRNMPDIPDHERTKLLADELATWLDFRRSVVGRSRRPGTRHAPAEGRRRL